MELTDKLRENIQKTAERYFVDPSRLRIGNSYLENFKLTMLWLATIMSKNVLIVGEPGFGKTTATKVVLAAYSGLPYSLYESSQLQGHPEQVEEKLIGRPDYSKLMSEEAVVWNKAIYLPGIIADEFNRLPGGKHAILLNAVETGRYGYLNDVLYLGKKPLFATANLISEGKNDIMLPMRDRFAFSFEFGYTGARLHENIRNATENIYKELSDEELTDKIIAILNNKDTKTKEKLRLMKEDSQVFAAKLERNGMHQFSDDDKEQLRTELSSLEISLEAKIFLQCINSEFNTTATYGIKRSNDLIDDSEHAKNMASSKVKNGLSPRGISAIEDMARGLALLVGDGKVTKEHINAIAPYALAHRLEFTDDYIDENRGKKRNSGDMFDIELARKILGGVEENYSDTVKDISFAYHSITASAPLPKDKIGALKNMFREEWIIDHPLTREYITEFKQSYLGLKKEIGQLKKELDKNITQIQKQEYISRIKERQAWLERLKEIIE